MKNLQKLIVLLFAGITMSCGGDDVVGATCSTNFAQSFEDEVTALNNASLAYGMDQSAANCEAFKNAYLDYIDALEDWDECAVFYNQEVEWQQALDSARESVNTIIC